MDTKDVQSTLLQWFSAEQRPLPWRVGYEPYQVWISEIMLQQTQVATVLPYFERWILELPTIAALADVPQDRLLKLWEGLGYYSRALNLKKAAQILVEKNDGKLYDTYEALLGLPGIGRYTAGAIMSIAYNKDYPVVDGNVIRVLARLLNYSGSVKEAGDFFWEKAAKLLPQGNARNFNQAMMEFGALQCTPRSPSCTTCPLKKTCGAFAAGTQELLPHKGVKSAKTSLKVAVAILENEGEVFIQKRASKGLMAGLWEFPGGKLENGEAAEQALERELKEELGLEPVEARPFMQLKHAYTRFQVDLQCFRAQTNHRTFTLKAASEGKWVKPEELKNYAFPAANMKIIDRLLRDDVKN